MKEALQKILNLPNQLNRELKAIRANLAQLNGSLNAFFIKPDEHFVAVYIECLTRDPNYKQPPEPKLDYGFPPSEHFEQSVQKVRRGTLGYSAFITREHTFRIQPYQILKGLRIVVFCDVSKVVIRSMQCKGSDLMAASDGSGACPIGYYDGELHPSEILYIVAEPRR